MDVSCYYNLIFISSTNMSSKWITHMCGTFLGLVWKIRLIALWYSRLMRHWFHIPWTCIVGLFSVPHCDCKVLFKMAHHQCFSWYLIFLCYIIIHKRCFSLMHIFFVQAMRLFVGDPIWTPFNRPHDHLPARYVFVSSLYCGHPYLSILV